MFNLLSLLSCQALTEASTTPIATDPKPEADEIVASVRAEVKLPAGEAIVRECYAREVSERRSRSSSSSTAARSAAPPPPSPVMPSPAGAPSTSAPMPSSAAAPSGGFGYSGSGLGGGGTGEGSATIGTTSTAGRGASTGSNSAGGGAFAGAKAGAPAAEAAAPAEPAQRFQGDTLADAGPSSAMSKPKADKAVAAKDESAGARANASERAKKEYDRDFQPVREESEAPYVDPNLDWGATVYLSNDDSMSLASAQRLLWAVQNKGSVSTSQIRPHELLNYFSFETTPVEGKDLFSVKGSAEQTEPGVMTFAFAVKGAVPERKPLDLTMVLDRSGSMSAEGRMDYLKRGLTKMSEQLVRGDRVDLVLFDDQVCTPLENYVVGRDDPSLLANAIAQLAPRGSTDLDLGLKEGYRIANARTDAGDRNRRMMLISDALLNTGDVNPNTVSEVAKAYEESDIRLTAIGVGRDFNDKVLDMLTEKGKGAYVYLGSEAVVDRVFGIGFPSLVQTIAHDVRFALDLPPSLAMKKFYGEESSTDPEDVQPIHYYAGTTQLFLQDLQLRGKPVLSDPVTLTVEWKDVDTDAPKKQVFTTTVGGLLESDPRNMRKGRALMAWTDMILARSLGNSPCGQPFSTWRERVDALGEDAEVQWLDGLTSPLCGATPVVPRTPVRGVAFKVKVDSDLPIAEVGLQCNGRTLTESLSASDTVARFDAATPGGCTLVLQGNVPMHAQVEVPTTGGEVRCTVRGGRMSCG
jgi:Ca-activated chloride channel family protein